MDDSARSILLQTHEDKIYCLVDIEDFEILNRHRWHPLTSRNTTYVVRYITEGVSEYMHHFIMGKPPRGMVIDHINDNGLDNRKSNLRVLPNSENIRRRYEINPLTGIKLMPDKIENPWKASVSVGGKTHHVGYFPTSEAAAEARKKFIEGWLDGNT